MGMIKLPLDSIDYFKNNLDNIFQTGNLAEGQWNERLEDYIKDTTGAKIAVCTNSNGAGLVALLSIYRYYYNRSLVLIQSNTMYGVKTMVPSGGCKLLGLISCQLETLMPSVQDIKDSISNLSEEEKSKLIILYRTTLFSLQVSSITAFSIPILLKLSESKLKLPVL